MIYQYMRRFFVLSLILKSLLTISHCSLQLRYNVEYSNSFENSSALSFQINATNSHTRYIRRDFTALLVECLSSNQSNVSLLCGVSSTDCPGSHIRINSTQNFISDYTCVINSNTSTAQNISITFLLGNPPTKSRNDTEIYLAENETSNLSVSFSALPVPLVRWFLNSNLVLSDTTNMSNLTVPFNDTFGTYSVLANNTFGSVSINFGIRLGQAPNITELIPTTFPLYFISGNNRSLVVVLTAAPAPATVTWRLSRSNALRNITNSSAFLVNSLIHNGSFIYMLTIRPFSANLTGIYTFRAENSFGYDSTNFSVSLGRIPNITSLDPSVSPHYVLRGSSVNITLNATAIPPPAVTWLFQGQELTGRYNYTAAVGADQYTHVLYIPITYCFGNYTVSVRNELGSDNATFILLKGQLPNSTNTTLTYVSNSTVKLYCTSDSPPPLFPLTCSGWFYNDAQLCGSAYQFEGTTLTIPQANLTHAGTYTCTPRNALGTANSTFTLVIHTRPTFLMAERADINITLFTSASLTLTCNANGIPTPQIRWTLNGIEFTSRYIRTDGLRSELTFDSLQDVKNGTYRCVAEANITISPGHTVLSKDSSNGTLLTVIFPPPPFVHPPSRFSDTLIFTGVFCTIIFLILCFIVAFAIICLLRKRIRSDRIMEVSSNKETLEQILNLSMVQQSEKSFVLVPKEHNMIDSLSETGEIEDINVRDIASYIEELKANDQLGFSDQYDFIRTNSPKSPSDIGDIQENKNKNRYNNIFCFDHSRVKLTPIDDAHNDFIHANFINGYNREREYIAAQGPLENTVEDFWRMVWEYRCHTIVMLTKCVENLKRKCAYYWVDEGQCTFFEMTVTHLSSLHLVDYAIIKLSIQPVDFTGDELIVSLFQFMSWPDFGTPDSPAGLLHFRNKVREAYLLRSTSPMVVHCSAGVGRSGTFIALDMELQRAAAEDRINPFNRVLRLREERNFLVQTEAQFVFLHFAILEGILFGYEDTPVADLPVLIDNLYKVDEEANKTGFELDFQALILTNIDSRQFSDGNLACNTPKNRRSQVVPYNKNRIKLTMLPGVEGSDYINASLIDSYAFKDVFIATQGPLESTVCDFWRMVFERNVRTVIMLCDVVERSTEVCVKYWPELGDTLDLDAVRVTTEGEESSDELKIAERDIKIEHKRLKSTNTIKHYHYTGWIDNRFPEDFNGLIELLDITNETTTENRKSPIVIHCTSGVGRTGVFIALFNSIEQVMFEESVNLFYVIKKLRLQRTQTIQSIHQYEFCYLALVECLRAIEEKDQSSA